MKLVILSGVSLFLSLLIIIVAILLFLGFEAEIEGVVFNIEHLRITIYTLSSILFSVLILIILIKTQKNEQIHKDTEEQP